MGWAEKLEKSYAGVWVPFAFTGAIAAGIQLIPRSLDDSAGNPPAVRQEAKSEPAFDYNPGVIYKKNGVQIDLIPAPVNHTIRLTLAKLVQQEWADKAPVTIIYPECNITTRLNLESQPCDQYEFTFPHQGRKKITCCVLGYDHLTKGPVYLVNTELKLKKLQIIDENKR